MEQLYVFWFMQNFKQIRGTYMQDGTNLALPLRVRKKCTLQLRHFFNHTRSLLLIATKPLGDKIFVEIFVKGTL